MSNKEILELVLVFAAANIVVWVAMFYFTWGTFGSFDPGDLFGFTRMVGFFAGIFAVGVWTIEN